MLGGAPAVGGRSGRGWPSLDLPHPPPPPAHQASAHIAADGLARYGVYSLLPEVYRYAQTVPAPAYHPLLPPAHKECVFTYPTGPGSPTYSAPVSQLQQLACKADKKQRLEAERRPRRRAWDPEPQPSQPQPQPDPACSCRDKPPTVSPGCSRTTPVSLRPAPQVKREAATPAPAPAPGVTPCQVAEVTTSAVKVKQEVVDPPAPAPTATSVSAPQGQGGIPVGIAVARQRATQQEVRVKEDAVVPPLAVLACERPTNQTLWATPPALPLAPPPAYWHATPLEPNVPLPPVGYQLARDPVSGQLLLLSAQPNIADSLQRTVVWPNSMGSFPPPLLLPQAPPVSHLLLDRLVTLTPTPPLAPPAPLDKRRAPAAPHGLLKIEDPGITGVMPCAKSSVVIQQLSAHSSPSLINPPFSAIASSGSVLIQHISGTNQPPAIIPHQNTGSVLISAQQLTTEQGLINSHPTISQPQVVIGHGQQDQSTTVLNPHVIGQLSSDLLGSHGPLVIAAPPQPQQTTLPPQQTTLPPPQSEGQLHLQIKESPKPVNEDVPEAVETQLEDKMEPINCCRSQATSPCPSPSHDSRSQSEDETSPPQQADASNQTDSLPPSDEEVEGEPSPPEASVAEPEVASSAEVAVAVAADKPAAVDLSGLELLSAASMEQFQRSHSAPLADPPTIKTEVEDPYEPTVIPVDVVVKKEVTEEAVVKTEEPVEEQIQMEEGEVGVTCERVEAPGIVGGLGLLCDVVHRVIEEEAANSRPHSPFDDGDHEQDIKSPVWTETEDLAEDRQSPSPEPERGPRPSLARYRPDSPVDPAEADMRERLAQLQRLYREKQRELSRLTPRKSSSSDASSGGGGSGCAGKRGPGRPRKSGTKRPRSPSPPPQLSPPVLEPWNLPPPTLTPHKALGPAREETQPVEWELVSPSKSPPPLSPAQSPSSASKKRKVGRPKKREDHGSLTIVAKKPRSKSSLVGLLLAKKHLPDLQHEPHKIRPKLKAEVKVKSWCEEEEAEWTTQPIRRHSAPASPPLATAPAPAPGRPVKSKSLPTPDKKQKKPIMVLAKRKRAVSTEQTEKKAEGPQPIVAQGVVSCQLTAEHLASLPCRVIVAAGGPLYAGTLSAITPPDLYGATLDGERGGRPHILSREETLTDAFLEVRVEAPPPPGTRVCAYWSQQYRCLYPGTVAPPAPDDSPRFVCVEFDDGDNGRICLDDIRLLPQDYPVVAYDPNPLQTLGKRRRRNSGASCDSQSKEKPVQPMETVTELEAEEQVAEHETAQEMEQMEQPEQTEQVVPTEEPHLEAVEQTATAQPVVQPEHITLSIEAAERERERRRLKKKRKEKLRRLDSEKKHRHKHRDCLKSHRHKHKHRHHRHKHRHSKNIVSVIGENASVEEKKPLTLVVHTKPATDGGGGGPPIVSTIKIKKDKKRPRAPDAASARSHSKMAAFLPARQLWGWSGRPYKRPGARGRARKEFYKTIQRGRETISVGDCAVFLSTGRPDRPYIGRIEAMWENRFQTMVVKVRWFYHPEETVGCPEKLPYPGALFESPHTDENDVQTISHRCEVLRLPDYRRRLALEPHRLAAVYDCNDVYYLAGHYNPTDLSLKFEPGVA